MGLDVEPAGVPARRQRADPAAGLRSGRHHDHPGDRSAVHSDLREPWGSIWSTSASWSWSTAMIGLITPPYGILSVRDQRGDRIPLREIIREVLPFLAVLIAALLVLIFVPELVLWLPRMFGYLG